MSQKVRFLGSPADTGRGKPCDLVPDWCERLCYSRDCVAALIISIGSVMSASAFRILVVVQFSR